MRVLALEPFINGISTCVCVYSTLARLAAQHAPQSLFLLFSLLTKMDAVLMQGQGGTFKTLESVG